MSGEGFTRLRTERLILRRSAYPDLAPFLAYRDDPEVARYQGRESCTERGALDFLRRMGSSEPGTPDEWFQFAVELEGDGVLVGNCALKVGEDGRQAEVGFTPSRERQGKGYASKAVSCLRDYAFGALGLHRVVAITDQENGPSFALLERLGMRREATSSGTCGSREVEGRWASEYSYAELADEWL